MIEKLAFSVKEAAQILGLNVETLRRAYRTGLLRGAMLGGQRKLLISRAELERFWEAHGGGQLFPNGTSPQTPKAKASKKPSFGRANG